MSPNRRQRRAFAASESWFRVVPVFRNADGNLEESVQASIIDGELDDCFVIRVPPTTSTAQAKLIEERLTQEMKRPCLVVTRNIEFCRVEPVSSSEMARLLKGVDRAPEDAPRAAPNIVEQIQNARRVLTPDAVEPGAAGPVGEDPKR